MSKLSKQSLYLGDDESKQTYRFFLTLYVSEDGKVLYSPKMQFNSKFKTGTRFIVKPHKEMCFHSRRMSDRYRLFIDESSTHTLPRGNGSEAD